MTTQYDKLVRDRIPEIIEDNDERAVTHVADEEEYERRLREKLVEEAAEFEASGDPTELGDVLEVIGAIEASIDTDWDVVEQRRESKAAAKGRFADRIVLERVEP